MHGGAIVVGGIGRIAGAHLAKPTRVESPRPESPGYAPSCRDPAALGGLLSLLIPGAFSADLSSLSLRKPTPEAEAFTLADGKLEALLSYYAGCAHRLGFAV